MDEPRKLSWSQLQTWGLCRKKWYWLYDRKIVPKIPSRALSLGSAGHIAMAAYLQNLVSDATTPWQEVLEKWVTERINEKPLFDEEIEEYQEVGATAKSIMGRYIASHNDEWRAVSIEKKFELGVSGVRNKLVGIIDAIVLDEQNHAWLVEHKFVKQFKKEDELYLNGQVGIYQYAALRLGYPVVGTIYNQILSKVPATPKLNKDGSMSRAKVNTDWETYKNALLLAGLDPLDYAEMEEKLQDNEFFSRIHIYRGPKEIKKFGDELKRRMWDASKKRSHIFKNSSHMTCSWCSYRELCIEGLKGGDVEYLIGEDFEIKKEKEEEPTDGNNQS